MVPYRRTEAPMSIALRGVKRSVLMPVLNRFHLLVSVLFFMVPYTAQNKEAAEGSGKEGQ